MRFLALLLLALCSLSVSAQIPVPTTVPAPLPADGFLRNPRLGLAHISAAEGGTPAERYRTALSLGAGWNRFPIYWDRVEGAPGAFDWSVYDRQIADDLLYDLQINAILLGRPSFYQDGGRISGMHLPIFADGTDIPAAGKQLNPDNVWARFVFEAINRYKPNGTASMTGTLQRNEGIRVWEIWNEPDVKMFWSGSIGDYARLLKVAYIAGKLADPDAKIMFAGLLFSTPDNWLARALAIYEKDPQAAANNWYMDAAAVHAYSDPWRTGWLVLNVKQTFIAYGIDKEIWVTEHGVPVWDDYPGPTWTGNTPRERTRRATQLQQAWYIIQSAVYGWLEGADVLIFHQLFDDCGDQPAGTDFPPNDGSVCTGDQLCSGDAHGLFRNFSSSVCFSQHPQPGTPRPAANAYNLLAQIFTGAFNVSRITLTTEQVSTQRPNGVFAAAFDMQDGRRISVLWNRTTNPTIVSLPATGDVAQIITLDGESTLTPNESRFYHIELPVAIPDGYPDLQPGAQSAIGGAPMILVEQTGGPLTPLVINRSLQTAGMPMSIPLPPAGIRATATPIPSVIIAPRATTHPDEDSQPPLAFVNPLPVTSPASFSVSWRGEDDGGIASYLVWVRVDKGDWQPWLETPDTSAVYNGTVGALYEFDIWARDLAGNWSSRVELDAQAITRVE